MPWMPSRVRLAHVGSGSAAEQKLNTVLHSPGPRVLTEPRGARASLTATSPILGLPRPARGDAGGAACSSHLCFLISFQRIKAVAAPKEVNRWSKETESGTPFCPNGTPNGGLIKPTHIIVETMM